MAIPYAMAHFYPTGLLGIGLVALIASFMSGQAGNVSAFNTIWTYDIYNSYINRDAGDTHLIWMGRAATVVGTLIAVGTAYWVRSFSTILNYEQLIFSIINVPLLAAVMLGMVWKRTTGTAALWGLIVGNVFAIAMFFVQGITAGSGLGDTYWRAWWTWLVSTALIVVISLFTSPKPAGELENLTLAYERSGGAGAVERVWYKKPVLLGAVVLAISLGLNIYYA